MCGAIPPLPPTSSWRGAWYRNNFTFTFNYERTDLRHIFGYDVRPDRDELACDVTLLHGLAHSGTF